MKAPFRKVGKPTLKYYVYFIFLENKSHPVYVGKGQKDRYRHYYYYPERVANKILRRKLLDLKEKGGQYQVEIIFETNSENEALDVEEFYISYYGRKFNETGVLYNFESGGIKSNLEQPARRKCIYVDGFVFDSVNRVMKVTGIKHETIKKYVSEGRASYLDNQEDIDRVFEKEKKDKWSYFYGRHRGVFRKIKNSYKASQSKLGNKNGMFGKVSPHAKGIIINGVHYTSIAKAAEIFGYSRGHSLRKFLESGKHNHIYKIHE